MIDLLHSFADEIANPMFVLMAIIIGWQVLYFRNSIFFGMIAGTATTYMTCEHFDSCKGHAGVLVTTIIGCAIAVWMIAEFVARITRRWPFDGPRKDKMKVSLAPAAMLALAITSAPAL